MVAVAKAVAALDLAATVTAHGRGMRRLDEEAAASLTGTAMFCITGQLDLAAPPVAIAVGISGIARVELTAPSDAAHTAMLRFACALALTTMLDRVGLDLTTVFRFLITVAAVLGAAHDLACALATHCLCVR